MKATVRESTIVSLSGSFGTSSISSPWAADAVTTSTRAGLSSSEVSYRARWVGAAGRRDLRSGRRGDVRRTDEGQDLVGRLVPELRDPLDGVPAVAQHLDVVQRLVAQLAAEELREQRVHEAVRLLGHLLEVASADCEQTFGHLSGGSAR